MNLTSEQYQILKLPISEDAPCGVNIKSDRSLFRSLRNEFNIAQSSLRQLTQNPNAEDSDQLRENLIRDWSQLNTSLIEQFSTKTRDIELISWCCVSQVILDHSLSTLIYWLQWFIDLVEQYWYEIHPISENDQLSPDEIQKEQIKLKTKAFITFIGDSEQSTLFYIPVLQLNLFSNVTLFDYQSAARKGEVETIKEVCLSILQTEKSKIQTQLNHTHQVLHLLDQLDETVNRKIADVGGLKINFQFVKAAFRHLENALIHVSGLRPEMTNDSEIKSDQTLAESESSETRASSDENQSLQNQSSQPSPTLSSSSLSSSSTLSSSSSVSSSSVSSSSVSAASFSEKNLMTAYSNIGSVIQTNQYNRDTAFHLLQEIADYFRQSEPHSPVSYLIEKAIRWGYLPMPDLIKTMTEESGGNWLELMFAHSGMENQDGFKLPERPMNLHSFSEPVAPEIETRTASDPLDSAQAKSSNIDVANKPEPVQIQVDALTNQQTSAQPDSTESKLKSADEQTAADSPKPKKSGLRW